MAEFDILDVEWHTAALSRDRDYLVRIDEQDACPRIEETPNQPGACDAVDLRPPSCHPGARRAPDDSLEDGFGDERQSCRFPGGIAAFQHPRIKAGGPQLRGRHLAELVPRLASSDDRTRPVEIVRPVERVANLVADCAGQQMR